MKPWIKKTLMGIFGASIVVGGLAACSSGHHQRGPMTAEKMAEVRGKIRALGNVNVGAIEEYKEEPTIDRISAVIYVARDSQKGILIGHQGSRLKKVGSEARADLEQFLGKKVFLQLFVKVNDDWRNNERQLRRFGYELE